MGGGGLGNPGNARIQTFFHLDVFPQSLTQSVSQSVISDKVCGQLKTALLVADVFPKDLFTYYIWSQRGRGEGGWRKGQPGRGVRNLLAIADSCSQLPTRQGESLKTSQELLMLSTVTLDCQLTRIVMNLGSQL